MSQSTAYIMTFEQWQSEFLPIEQEQEPGVIANIMRYFIDPQEETVAIISAMEPGHLWSVVDLGKSFALIDGVVREAKHLLYTENPANPEISYTVSLDGWL